MLITDVKDQKQWQEFVEKLNLNTFLHSNQWAEFNKISKKKIWQLGMYQEDELISVCLVIKMDAKKGNFLLIPHGPQTLTNQDQLETLTYWKKFLIKLGQMEKCNYIRIQPILEHNQKNLEIFEKLGTKKAPIHVHTELTSVLDIRGSEKEILKNMRKTTRQMIKKAEKLLLNGEIELLTPDEINQEMHEVYKQTYRRGGAVAYSSEYINNEWEAFKKDKKAKLFVVKYKQKIISWGMMLISGKRCFYHQGGNILNRDIPSAYFIQWQGIKYAKEKGCISYDFWGVSPLDKANHPWKNISLFKRGFGGQDERHLEARDWILNWKYYFSYAVDKYRAFRRGF
jgi:lipid II:glycine glycyltransferase (peptidoglycan interpeptide bridge formation enzyme)